MPIIDKSIDAVKQMRGLHLFHTDISNCCDRVRIALAEKGLPWESHFFVLPRGDHLTEEFFSINPNGVVPVLIDDGTVITESNDIIQYLDEKYTLPRLSPASDEEKTMMYNWMASAAEYHPFIAALSFEFMFKVTPYSPEFFKRRAELKKQAEPEMERIFNPETGSVYPEVVKRAIAEANQAFNKLEQHLTQHSYLMGEQFTLADISWAVQIHRLKTVRLKDINNYPNLCRWYHQLEKRASIQQGMINWETAEPYALFNQFIDQREAEGTDINALIWRE